MNGLVLSWRHLPLEIKSGVGVLREVLEEVIKRGARRDRAASGMADC